MVSDMLSLIKSGVSAMGVELTFEGETLDEAKIARDAYFSAHPDELARFEDNPSLSIELRAKPREEAPVVQVKPHSYQPSKAEVEEDVSVDASPEALRAAVMRTVRLEETDGC